MCAVSKPASSIARSTASAITDSVISSGSGGPPAWPGSVGASTSCERSSAGSTSSHERHVSVKPWISTSGSPEPPRWNGVKTLPSDRTHPIVACVVLDLRQTHCLEHGWDVIPEPSSQPILHPVPAADGVVGRAAPGLHRALRGRLLLVGAAERNPVARRLQHRVEVVDAAQLVAQLGGPHLHHERGRIRRLVAVRLVLRLAGRRLEGPGIVCGSGGHRLAPFWVTCVLP